jgi:hypothetical protein
MTIARLNPLIQKEGFTYNDLNRSINDTANTVNQLVDDANARDIHHNPIITPVTISGTTVDWSTSGYQYKFLNSNVTLNFFKNTDGMQLTLYLKADGNNRAVVMPTVLWPSGTPLGTTVTANTYNIYTFVQIFGKIFATALVGMA